MKISKGALKKLVSEEVSKLKKISVLKEEKEVLKNKLKVLKEYDDYNYPAGADADPSAPWNQVDNEFEGEYEIVDDGDNTLSFSVEMTDSGGGTATAYLEEMLEKIGSTPKTIEYFEVALLKHPRPEGFKEYLDSVVNSYSEYADFDNYPEPDEHPDPDRKYDERDEAVKTLLRQVIKVCHENNTKIGICGQGPSDYPDFAEFLVREGIDTISLTPDSVIKNIKLDTLAMVEVLKKLKEVTND